MIGKVEELNQVEIVKDLYYKSKFEDCINKVNGLKDIQSFLLYQHSQLYKSLSLIEQGYYHQGFKNLEQLITESSIKKGEKVEEIDLIIRIFQLWELYFYNSNRAEIQNKTLRNTCEEFLRQNSADSKYNHGIYLFGKGSYLFFENMRCKNQKESIELLQKASSIVKEYEQDIILIISFVYNEQDNFEKSIEYLNKLLKMNPQFPGIYNYFAILYEKKSDYKEAEEYYFKALKLLPNNTIILNNIASFYQNIGEEDKSEKYIIQSYEINPNSSYTCFVYGSILNQQKRIDKAIEILKLGIKYDNMDCDLYYELYKIEYGKKNYVKCIQLLEECCNINPLEGFYQYEIGRIYEENQSYDTAEKYLKTALKMQINDSTRIEASTLLANCFYWRKLYYEAFEQYLYTLNLNISNIDMKVLLINTSHIINNLNFLCLKSKIRLIDSFNGCLLSRLDSLIQKVTYETIIPLLKYKLENHQMVLTMNCYQQNVQPYLTYQNELSHWDLYFD